MKEYTVKGMSCAACSARVEQAVSKVEGVVSCSVSLLTESMTVEGEFQEATLTAAVKKAGYEAFPKNKKERVTKAEKENSLLPSLLVSVGLLLLLMYVSMGSMLSLPLPSFFTPLAQGIYQAIISLGILVLHRRFFVKGVWGLFCGAPNMDTLVAVGAGASYLYSVVRLVMMFGKTHSEQHHLLHGLYFESAAMILVLITVGKLMEARSRGKTGDAIRALQKLMPSQAMVLREGKELLLPLEQIKTGDRVVVLPGESFPVDGSVIEGEGAVDESALTGESIPVDKGVSHPVYTGTVNLSSRLVIEAEKIGGDTVLSRMIERVTAASASKAPIARLADRVSGVFVPVVMVLSLVTFAIWFLLVGDFETALSRGITVLVVSCPCALGLATPVAVMVGNGVAAQHGVLFKTAVALEEAGKTKIAVLDKTGTITEGKLELCDVLPWEGICREELLSLAVALEQESTHPIARAVTSYGKENQIEPMDLTEVKTIAGFGMTGLWRGERVLCGNQSLAEQVILLTPSILQQGENLAKEGKTPLFFSVGERFYGFIALRDTIKADAAQAVAELKKMGIRPVMLTGDREEVAASVAAKVGIEEYAASVLPEEKAEWVWKLKSEGKTCMVGDGINDAAALVSADLGVCVGGGMDIAMDAAEVVLMKDSLCDLPRMIALSRKTLVNIKENLFWAFCYNIVGIPLAAGAFSSFGLELTPMFGAAAMSLSSFLVVSNALRLRAFSWEKTEKKEKGKKKQMEKIIKIDGMMCPHCEAQVKKALEALEGVAKAIPSHEKKEAKLILSAKVDDEVLKKTIEDLGYQFLN